MALVTSKEIARVIGLHKLGFFGTFVGWVLLRILRISAINKIYDNNREIIKSFVMYVNCSHGKGIKFIREDLKFFAKTHINSNGGNTFKSVVLLNADKLTLDAQSALRRCIELFSHNTRFFIIVEDKYKFVTPERCCWWSLRMNKIIKQGSLRDSCQKHAPEVSNTIKSRSLNLIIV